MTVLIKKKFNIWCTIEKEKCSYFSLLIKSTYHLMRPPILKRRNPTRRTGETFLGNRISLILFILYLILTVFKREYHIFLLKATYNHSFIFGLKWHNYGIKVYLRGNSGESPIEIKKAESLIYLAFSLLWRQRESNPCYHRERVVS